MTKAFWKSKTLWLNVVGVGLVVGKRFGFDVPTPTPEQVLVINVLLRLISSKGLSVS